MENFIIKRKFNLSSEKIWNGFDDFGGVYKFHPLIEASPTLNEKESGLGCERECQFYDGGAIRERITKYDKGKHMTVEIYEHGPFPMKEAIADVTVNSLGQNKSELIFEMKFKPKYGPVGWLMGKAMMKPKFKKIINQVFDGLETHITTGKYVGKKGVLIEAPAI